MTTSLTVSTFETERHITGVGQAKSCLVHPGELLSADGAFFKRRYKIQLSVENEANIMSIINEIIDGTIAYNRRDGSYTEVSVMCNIKFVYTNKSRVDLDGRWNQDIFLDIEWSTS